VESADEGFLFTLYASTRSDEMAAWGWSALQQDAFLQMQYRVRQAGYRAQYPQAAWQIVLLQDQAVGQLVVDTTGEAILLIDIALLPQYRNAGIGSSLIRTLLEEAKRTGKVVRLHVVEGNPAQRLYERLGFVKVGEEKPYISLEWRAATITCS
jgi:ribosomal protein S18 acetylase RimI-like enzyme